MKVQVEDIDGIPWFQLFDRSQDLNFQSTTLDDIVAIQKHFEDNIKIIKY